MLIPNQPIWYAVQRIIDSVWTLAFQYDHNNEMVVLFLDNNNPIGYNLEDDLPKFTKKESEVGRILQEVTLYDKEYKSMNSKGFTGTTFLVSNPAHVFSYTDKQFINHDGKIPLSLYNLPEEIPYMLEMGVDFEKAKDCLRDYNNAQEVKKTISKLGLDYCFEFHMDIFRDRHEAYEQTMMEDPIVTTQKLERMYGLDNLIKLSEQYQESFGETEEEPF